MTSKKKIVVLTGAGISQESGIKTFRDYNGLWENHKIEEVATPEAFERNPTLVLNFYNLRRKQLQEVKPNKAHYFLKELEALYNVTIITQNIDDLHERAGSKNIIHLHGELMKARSVKDDSILYPIQKDIQVGDVAQDGGQLRPHVVWFGEMVPEMDNAIKEAQEADIFIVIGTSLQVYPAASLVQYTKTQTPIYIIDPSPILAEDENIHSIQEKATKGCEYLRKILL